MIQNIINFQVISIFVKYKTFLRYRINSKFLASYWQ